nr:MAG TPA: hypothetical protein [Caudoviricetes sp.]DAZ26295.1 MAG TPA: hypothetical protein [Caudoviricetes sp.]
MFFPKVGRQQKLAAFAMPRKRGESDGKRKI